jgi:hypothetical protein
MVGCWRSAEGSVLPDGPPALSHPTNEDLFVGTPIRRSLRDVYTFSGRGEFGCPPVGRRQNQ